MLSSLVPLAVVLATAAPETSRLQVNFIGSAGYVAITPPPPIAIGPLPSGPVGSTDEHSVVGSGGLSLTIYPTRPLADDDAPLSLQPFLERLTTLHLSASGGGFDTRASTSSPRIDSERAESHAAVSASADVYATRHFIAGGSLGFAWSTTRDTISLGADVPAPSVTATTWSVPLSLWLGGRFRDTRVDASWSVTPASIGGSWQVPTWYGVGATLQSVFARMLNLYVNVHAIDQGAFATLEVGVYPYRRVGFYGSFFGGGGRLYLTDAGVFERFGGMLGASLWRSRHFGGSFTYSPSWTSGPSANVQHLFTVEVFSRLR